MVCFGDALKKIFPNFFLKLFFLNYLAFLNYLVFLNYLNLLKMNNFHNKII